PRARGREARCPAPPAPSGLSGRLAARARRRVVGRADIKETLKEEDRCGSSSCSLLARCACVPSPWEDAHRRSVDTRALAPRGAERRHQAAPHHHAKGTEVAHDEADLAFWG